MLADRANRWALRDLPRAYRKAFPLNTVRTAAFSPDGTLVLAASLQGGVGWWDVVSGRQVWSRPDLDTAVNRLSHPQAAFTADSTRILAVGYADTLSLLDTKSGAETVLRFSPGEPWDGEAEKLEQILLARARGSGVTGMNLPDEEISLLDDLTLFDQPITADDVSTLSRAELRFVRNTDLRPPRSSLHRAIASAQVRGRAVVPPRSRVHRRPVRPPSTGRTSRPSVASRPRTAGP